MSKISRNLKAYKRAHNMKTDELADLMRIPVHTLEDWERGQDPRFGEFVEACRRLKTPHPNRIDFCCMDPMRFATVELKFEVSPFVTVTDGFANVRIPVDMLDTILKCSKSRCSDHVTWALNVAIARNKEEQKDVLVDKLRTVETALSNKLEAGEVEKLMTLETVLGFHAFRHNKNGVIVSHCPDDAMPWKLMRAGYAETFATYEDALAEATEIGSLPEGFVWKRACSHPDDDDYIKAETLEANNAFDNQDDYTEADDPLLPDFADKP